MAVLLLWAVLDIAINTFTSFRCEPVTQDGNTTSATNATYETNVTSAVLSTDVAVTLLDLWALGLTRVFLVIAWAASLSRCVSAKRRGADVVYYVTIMTSMVTWMYACAKLLLLSEEDGLASHGCRHANMGWTFAACAITIGLLLWSRRQHVIPADNRFRKHSNLLPEEQQPLIGFSTNPKEKNALSSSGSPLWQLCRLSVPDLPVVLPGLLFLGISVACEIMLPRYIGEVIDSLVVDRSQTAFHTAIVRLSLVAVSFVVCTWIRMWLFSRYVACLTARIRRRLFASVMSQDLHFFDQHETGLGDPVSACQGNQLVDDHRK